MFKIVANSEKKRIVRMCDMEPGQIGVVEDENSSIENGTIVMRTLSNSLAEVMNMSEPRRDNCWTGTFPNTRIRLFEPGTRITLEIK